MREELAGFHMISVCVFKVQSLRWLRIPCAFGKRASQWEYRHSQTSPWNALFTSFHPGFLYPAASANLLQPCPDFSERMDCLPPSPSVPLDSPGGNAGVSCRALLSGASSQPGWNPGLSRPPGSFPLLPPGKPLSALLLTEYLCFSDLFAISGSVFFTPFSLNLWLSPWVLSKILSWILSLNSLVFSEYSLFTVWLTSLNSLLFGWKSLLGKKSEENKGVSDRILWLQPRNS